ncbi:MAG: hypothetical protein N2050_04800 [Flavobacteriales bacterium]|nr:hypothetical protein [Flavobacteriales bacterium]
MIKSWKKLISENKEGTKQPISENMLKSIAGSDTVLAGLLREREELEKQMRLLINGQKEEDDRRSKFFAPIEPLSTKRKSYQVHYDKKKKLQEKFKQVKKKYEEWQSRKEKLKSERIAFKKDLAAQEDSGKIFDIYKKKVGIDRKTGHAEDLMCRFTDKFKEIAERPINEVKLKSQKVKESWESFRDQAKQMKQKSIREKPKQAKELAIIKDIFSGASKNKKDLGSSKPFSSSFEKKKDSGVNRIETRGSSSVEKKIMPVAKTSRDRTDRNPDIKSTKVREEQLATDLNNKRDQQHNKSWFLLREKALLRKKEQKKEQEKWEALREKSRNKNRFDV